jgi:hypothetical protein
MDTWAGGATEHRALPEGAPKVFLSHTADLARRPRGDWSFVAAGERAVQRADAWPIERDRSGTAVLPPAHECAARVRECQIFVAVVGHRYGPVVPGLACSYPEYEYETAQAAGLACIAFLAADDAPLEQETDPDQAARQQAFRERLRQEVPVAEFRAPEELETGVLEAVAVWRPGRARRPRPVPTRSAGSRAVMASLAVLVVLGVVAVSALSVLTHRFPPDISAVTGTRRCSGVDLRGAARVTTNTAGGDDVAFDLVFTNTADTAASVPGWFDTTIRLVGGPVLSLYQDGSPDRASVPPAGTLTRRYTARNVPSVGTSAEVKVTDVLDRSGPFDHCQLIEVVPVT